MNSGLLLLSIGLTALIGSICTILYSRVRAQSEILEDQQDLILRMEKTLKSLVEIQTSTQHCMSELSTEMQLRDVYQNANDRHKLAIKSAKNGKNRMELMRQHGLSTDEAALIISLHGGGVDYEESTALERTRPASKEAELTEA